jgi:hypothetical protein
LCRRPESNQHPATLSVVALSSWSYFHFKAQAGRIELTAVGFGD